MKVLITGGSGFLGTNLYQYIRKIEPNVDVQVFDLSCGDDVRDYYQVEKAVIGCDLVIHAAAQTHVDFSLHNKREDQVNFLETNAGGTLNVIHACQKYNVKMIHISTSEVYGTNLFPGKPMNEAHPILAQAGIYATSKACADLTARMATLTTNTNIVILRPFNFWGPGQSVEKLIPRMLYQGMNHKDLTIYGDGTQKRDYVYIQDVCEAIWRAKNLPSGTICNIASGKSVSIDWIAGIIMGLFIGTRRKYVDKRPAEVKELRGDYSVLHKLTGWEPTKFITEDSLRELLGYYKVIGYIQQPKL